MPDSDSRLEVMERAAALLNRHWSELPGRRIGPTLTGSEIDALLAALSFEKPRPLASLVEQSIAVFAGGMVQCAHPRHFGLFVPSPSFAGVVGEMLAAGLNMQLASASYAPAAVAAERMVLDSVAGRLGLGVCGGHFTGGGSEANLAGALVALTHAFPEYGEAGLPGMRSSPVLYTSRDAHSCWFKIAHQLGLGRLAVRTVDTDGTGRMDGRRLRRAIAADRRSGNVPFLIVATAGTTNAGMIDPLDECADIARAEGLWLHVDAAWGGGLVASDRGRHTLAGIGRANSVTLDPHKLLSVPMGCGIFLSRRGRGLTAAFQAGGSYMPPEGGGADPYSNSAQWSRRFIGLKLFLSLASVGWVGHGAAVDRQLAMAKALRRALEKEEFEVLNRSPLGVLCFLPHGGADVDALARLIQQRGRCWITAAEFEGTRVLRACVTSFRTGPADVAALVGELKAVLR